jgi:hypothetical protein
MPRGEQIQLSAVPGVMVRRAIAVHGWQFFGGLIS